MTNYEYGDVVLVLFTQSGKAERKQRPGIVVLYIGDADLVIAPVTSRAHNLQGDVAVSHLPATGLLQPSSIRLAKVATMLKTDIVRTLGRLSELDRKTVATQWQSIYADFVT